MNWGWPQFAMAGIMAVSWGISLARYGQAKQQTYDIVDILIGPALNAWLLYMGGFWTP